MKRPHNKRIPKGSPEETLVLELYRDGLSTNRVGERLGHNKGTICRIVKAYGKLRFSRLTEEQENQIVEM
jgi:hypothetical protein